MSSQREVGIGEVMSDRELWREEKKKKRMRCREGEKNIKEDEREKKKERMKKGERKIRRFWKIFDFISLLGFLKEIRFINSRVVFSSKIILNFVNDPFSRELIKIVLICVIS